MAGDLHQESTFPSAHTAVVAAPGHGRYHAKDVSLTQKMVVPDFKFKSVPCTKYKYFERVNFFPFPIFLTRLEDFSCQRIMMVRLVWYMIREKCTFFTNV